MADEIKLDGLDALKATLARLPGVLEEKVLRAALRAGAQVIRKDAQARVKVLQEATPYRKPGTVRDAITVRRSKQDKLGVFIGVKPLGKKQIAAFKKDGGGAGARNPADPFYWIFLEFGTANMPAAPFLRPAFEANKFAALRRFEEFSKRRVVREAEKLAKEQGSKTA